MNRFGLPNLGIGVGLRTVHYGHILEHQPPVDWFEIISENYMQTAGRPLLFLDRIAERYPVVMHGVSLSIGSTDPLDFDYLRELKSLRDRVGARWISDHLCWTAVSGTNSHDLLPLPYTEEALRTVAARVRIVQDFLGAPLALENPSTYVEFAGSTLTEWEFLAALADEADCALLLDVNNVYVSALNHGFDPREYLARVPYDRVVQLHVAGHTRRGAHVIDTHIGPVSDPVWMLLREARQRCDAPVLLEWDEEIPEFDAVHREALRANEFLGETPVPQVARAIGDPASELPLRSVQEWFLGVITHAESATAGVAAEGHRVASSEIETVVRPSADESALERLDIYHSSYFARLVECLADDFPATKVALGDDAFEKLCRAYTLAHPSRDPNLNGFGRRLPAFVRGRRPELGSFVAELSHLEWLLVEAVHAKAAEGVSTEALAQIPPEKLSGLRFVPSPALRFLATEYPVNRYLQAFHDGEQPNPPERDPSLLAIVRHAYKIWRLELAPEQGKLLRRLVAGAPLGTALAEVDASPDQVQAWFRDWTQHGVFETVLIDGGTGHET